MTQLLEDFQSGVPLSCDLRILVWTGSLVFPPAVTGVTLLFVAKLLEIDVGNVKVAPSDVCFRPRQPDFVVLVKVMHWLAFTIKDTVQEDAGTIIHALFVDDDRVMQLTPFTLRIFPVAVGKREALDILNTLAGPFVGWEVDHWRRGFRHVRREGLGCDQLEAVPGFLVTMFPIS